MQFIKFDTITSTNEFLKSYTQVNFVENFFYIYTDLQTHGKGQRSNVWLSECCKNIMVSFCLHPDFPATEQIRLNHIISVAIVKVLEKFNIPDLAIKLPNDILSGSKKISGILIENIIAQNKIKQTIIGIGLNVNQTDFVNLPNAVSMKLLTGADFETEIVLNELIFQLQKYYKTDAKTVADEFNKKLISNVL